MRILDITRSRVRTTLLALGILAIARPGAAQVQPIPTSVTDGTTCGVMPVTIARTPQLVRIQRQILDGQNVLTLDGVFANLPAGTTFHVTHVSGMFFTDGPQDSQIRLYRGGVITAAFNLPEDSFHQENSTIQSKTLNQPVDIYFPIGNDPGEWDLQLIRQNKTGIASAIAEFWGYMDVDTCPRQ